MLGVQEFVQPSIEYVIQAENAEQVERDDREGGDPRGQSVPPPFRRESRGGRFVGSGADPAEDAS
jgi:hypothetical protein